MWVFLAADSMGFAGLLAAYAALRARGPTVAERLASTPRLATGLALLFTMLLLASSASISAAVAQDDHRSARRWVLATMVLGTAFIVGQSLEFSALLGRSAGGFSVREPAAALFVVLIGYHGLHVLAGLVVLARLAIRTHHPAAAKGASGALAVAALYWQFVDLVWLVLFAALYLLPAASGV
jgi:heme/copper-type cytochrome/quinol oxidase subunit 3